MNALHYAAYFDVPELIRVLLKATKPRGTHTHTHTHTDHTVVKAQRCRLISCFFSSVLNSTCSDFHYGTALHIAASNLCLGAVKCLLEHGANPIVRVKTLTLNQPGLSCGRSGHDSVPEQTI